MFFQMNKTGLIYIPIAFYCHIKRKIWLKIVLKYSLYFKNSTIFEQKFFFEYFFNFLFLSKMLSFQDFSRWTNILKSTVQYLSRDISTIKIGQFLRQSHKKHWKTLFCPTAFKIKKIKKFDIPSHKFFEYLSSKKKILKIGPPQIGVWRGSLAVDTLLCPYLYVCTMYVCIILIPIQYT